MSQTPIPDLGATRRGATAAKLVTCVIAAVLAAVLVADAYRRYQAAMPSTGDPGLLFQWGDVQAVIPTADGEVVTEVTPGIRIDEETFRRDELKGIPWFPKADRKYLHHIRVAVTLPRPVANPPEVVAILLTGDARNSGPLPSPLPGGSRAVIAETGGGQDGVVVVALADGQDAQKNATAIVNITVSSRLGWCKGKQCFIKTPTIKPPLWEPQLAAMRGDLNATVDAHWWDRILNSFLYQDKPKKVNGIQRTGVGIPLSADVTSAVPAPEPAEPGRIQWSSPGDLSGFVKVTDSDLETAQQNGVFFAGIEVGVATALAPWAIQLLFEVALSRRRRAST